MTTTSPGPAPLSALPGQIWQTRAHRPRDGGWLGGVSVGLARRYDVDPVLVRVAFVVAALLGGGGVPVYLALWLLLPADGDAVSAGESLLRRGRASMSRLRAGLLAGLLALTLLTSGDSGGLLAGGGVIGAGLLLVGLGLLHRRRPELPRAPGAAAPVDLSKDAADPEPPTWDPLGTAPFAWDLPTPTQAPPPRRPRSRHTPLTLGVALLVVAAAVALRLVTGWAWLDVAHVAALALAVVGAGLVVGALRHRGWGLLPVAIPLAGFVVLASLVGSADGRPGFGDQSWAPTTTAGLADRYQGELGATTLDLRGLDLTTDRSVQVLGGVGEVVVTLPASLDVELSCTPGLGDLSCPWQGLDPGDDGAGGPVLSLDVRGNIGDVAVSRG